MTRILSAAAGYWTGYVQRGGESNASTLIFGAVLIWALWRPAPEPTTPVWACEHQTNTPGKDAIDRHRDPCPVPLDGSTFVDTDL